MSGHTYGEEILNLLNSCQSQLANVKGQFNHPEDIDLFQSMADMLSIQQTIEASLNLMREVSREALDILLSPDRR